jgi:hypothetical protein
MLREPTCFAVRELRVLTFVAGALREEPHLGDYPRCKCPPYRPDVTLNLLVNHKVFQELLDVCLHEGDWQIIKL